MFLTNPFLILKNRNKDLGKIIEQKLVAKKRWKLDNCYKEDCQICKNCCSEKSLLDTICLKMRFEENKGESKQ